MNVFFKNVFRSSKGVVVPTFDLFGSELEYNTTQGIRGYVQKLSNTRFVIANYQSATVQNVQTFELNRTTGGITANGSPLTFYNLDGASASIISITVIDESHLAIFWTGDAGDGFCRTFEVDSGGTITAWGAQLEFDTTNGGFNSSILLGTNHILNIWQGTDSDGFAAVFEVDMSTGDMSIMGTPFEFDTDLATRGSLVKISDNKALVCYNGNSSDGYARVLSINTSTWAVTGAGSSFEWFDASTINQNSVEIMSTYPTLTAVNAFDNNLNAGLRQLSINTSTWAVTNLGTPVTGIAAVNQNNSKRVVHRLSDSYFLYFYTGASNLGYAELREYNASDGTISAGIDTVNFDATNAISISSCDMGGGIFVAIWGGSGNDGYVRSFITSISTVNQIELATIPPARVSTDFDLSETFNAPELLFNWELIDSGGSVADTAIVQEPTFNLSTLGLYDLRVTVSKTNSLSRYIPKQIIVKPAAFEEGDADVVLDLSAIQAGTFTNPLGDASISGNGTTNFLYDFNEVSRPGLKIYLKGTYAGRIQIVGLQGTLASPVIIQSPTSGQAVIEEDYVSQTMALHFNGFNQYVHIDGRASSDQTYGIKIQGNGTDEARGILWQGDQQKGFVVAGVEFDGVRNPADTTAGGAAFQYSPPTPDVGENASNWDSEYLIFHNNYIHDGWGEGIYINFNDDAPVGGLYYNRTALFMAFDNIIERMLRDGIQFSSCDEYHVFRNTIDDIGQEASTSHRSGIVVNPGNNTGYIYNNFVTNVDVALAAQSGDTGTGAMYFYSNFCKQRDTILTATPNQFVYMNVNDLDCDYNVFNNTLICPTVAIAPVTIERSTGGESYNFTFAGNVMSTGGTDQATYDELRIVGTHDQTDWSVGNVWERTASEADLLLNANYSPGVGSPALDGGFNWQSRFVDLFTVDQRNRDIDGYSLYVNSDYIAGAYRNN